MTRTTGPSTSKNFPTCSYPCKSSPLTGQIRIESCFPSVSYIPRETTSNPLCIRPEHNCLATNPNPVVRQGESPIYPTLIGLFASPSALACIGGFVLGTICASTQRTRRSRQVGNLEHLTQLLECHISHVRMLRLYN